MCILRSLGIIAFHLRMIPKLIEQESNAIKFRQRARRVSLYAAASRTREEAARRSRDTDKLLLLPMLTLLLPLRFLTPYLSSGRPPPPRAGGEKAAFFACCCLGFFLALMLPAWSSIWKTWLPSQTPFFKRVKVFF